MKKRLSFSVCLLAFMLVLLSACGTTSNDASAPFKNQSQQSKVQLATRSHNNAEDLSNSADEGKGTQNNESKKAKEKQKTSNGDEPSSTSQSGRVSFEKMKHFKKTLGTFIFDKYMSGPDYVYAKGVNWVENFYDNLTPQEIWNVIEAFKKKNNGKEGTMFQKARYLSLHAPIKDNWKELFMENWENGDPSRGNEIEKLIDHGETVGVYTKSHPYTGEKDNYPLITLNKRTGYWHG